MEYFFHSFTLQILTEPLLRVRLPCRCWECSSEPGKTKPVLLHVVERLGETCKCTVYLMGRSVADENIAG